MYDERARKNLYIVYLIFIGTTIFLWVSSKPSIDSIFRLPLVSLVQICGLTAASLVSLNLLLAARLSFFENLFGGLDKVYRQHRLTGELAFVFMLTHPTLLLINAFPNIDTILAYTINFSDWALNFGKLAITGFSAILILTLFVRIPYHIWRRIHQLMIIPLIFLTLHVFTIPSDVSTFLPLRFWMLGILTAGILIYVYKVIFYKFIGPKFDYEIVRVNPKGQITEIILKPVTSALSFEPGQFVFAVFGNREVGPEEHPFSISSAPGEPNIRLSIKKSGDFTSTLPKLKKGDVVKLYGPYGQFGKNALATQKDVIMIAGGIGITPFLSIVNYINDKNINKNYNLIYSYKDETDSSYKEELAAVAGKSLTTHNSQRNGHLTAQTIADKVGGITEKLILLCGPKGMMKALTEQFLALGVKQQNIIYEDFDLKG